jgi:hypothetical protein
LNQDSKRKLENQLLTMGLAGLNDPELIQQLADLVSAWPGDKHDFLRDLINECEPDKRYEMYHAIAPKLRFKALSLPQYEAQIALKAGEMVSQRRMRVEGDRPQPIEIGGHKVQITSQERANCGWAVVRCHVCNRVEKFISDTPVGAVIEARKAGWKKDPAVDLEICLGCQALQVADSPIQLEADA